jgi:outer membrane lipoprotein SlyB
MARMHAGRGLLAALLACLAVAVHGQSIRIPDFREPPRATLAPGETCQACGTIRSIREVRVQRPVTVPRVFQNDPIDQQGPASPVIVGAVIALPLGGGSADKPFVGGVGTPEMRERFSETTYDVTVQFDNGGYSMVQRADGASFRVGDRVRLRGIELELLAP